MAGRAPLVQTRPEPHDRARGLVSSRSSGRRVRSETILPPPSLRDVVATFWIGEWDLPEEEPHETELLGDPCMHVVIEDGETRREGRVVGVWTHLWRRRLEVRGKVVGVKIRAGAAKAFFDEPASHYTDAITPLEDVFGPSTRRLEQLVRGAPDDSTAIGHMSAWLVSRRRPRDREDTSLAVALVERITNDLGITKVEHLEVASGLHRRVLERLFAEHVGAPPKHVIRRHRLQEVALRLERGEAPSLADLAAELGYTDQSHLTRDFKSVVGKSPREFGLKVHE
ncbi:MAG: AraC family transcriptional regulator [Myxococcales bacterium]|nr:AraC family transcriptional regulator [Myxococcales bacterium]